MPWIFRTLTGLQLVQLLSQVGQVDSQITPGAIVVRIRISGIEVDQSCDSFGMARAYGTQLFAAEGVAGQYRPVELECVEDGEDVVTETIGRVRRIPGG